MNTRRRQNLNGQQGEETQPSNPLPGNNQGGVYTHRELRVAGAQTDSDYYNPNPWARILGRANDTDVEINGVISKALIDSGAMISMMSRDYCYEQGYEIQPLEHLVHIEGSGGQCSLCGVCRSKNAYSWDKFFPVGMSSCSLALPPLDTIKEYQSW